MTRMFLFLFAAIALLGIGAGGALLLAPERIAIVVGVDPGTEHEAPAPPPRDRTDEVLREMQTLQDGLVTIGGALDFAASDREQANRRISAIDRRLDTIAREQTNATKRAEQFRQATRAAVHEKTPEPPKLAQPIVADPEPAPAPPKPEPVAPKRQTLAELLARKKRTDPRDRATRWLLLPKHGRVGFDGRSTIHNFTARSDRVDGALTLHWNALDDAAGGELRIDVGSLGSGVEGRDKEIRKQLGEGNHKLISCRILALRPSGKEHDGIRTAVAKVRFEIHGRTHEVEAQVKLTFTRERLLRIQGETKLRMSDFGIRPAAKLGVIKVDDEVAVWWDLYAEPEHAKS